MRPASLLLRGGAIVIALAALGAPAGAAEPDAETAKRLAVLTAERDELARRVAEQSAWLEAAADEQRALLARLRSLTGSDSDRARLAAQVAELTAQLEGSRAEPAQVHGEGVSWASTTVAVNLRSGPGLEHRRLETLPVGTRVEVTGGGEGWTRVRTGSREGWVAAEYLRPEGGEVNALRGRIRELESGLAAARRAASAATAELQAVRRAGTEGGGAPQSAAAERDRLAERLRRLESEDRDSATRAAELERRLAESSETRTRLADQLGELAARNGALEAANAALETSRRDLAAELASARGEITRRERQSARQAEEIRQRLRAAEATAAELLAWLESLQPEKTTAEAR